MNAYSNDFFSSLPETKYISVDEYKLGQRLFFDKRLSKDNSTSCASCHSPSNFGVDGKALSVGANSLSSVINTPSIYNSPNNSNFFIDGRANNLKEAIFLEVENIRRFNTSWGELIEKLNKINLYRTKFKEVYSQNINSENVVASLESYVKSLVLSGAKIDNYLNGVVRLTLFEKKGLNKFKRFGCHHCHNGVNFGGSLFSTKGEFVRGPDRDIVKTYYYGRYNVTKDEGDLYLYKVPSLRNVEFTAPYYYFGESKTLELTVESEIYNRLGIKPSKKDINEIIEFLKTLSAPNLGEKYVN